MLRLRWLNVPFLLFNDLLKSVRCGAYLFWLHFRILNFSSKDLFRYMTKISYA